MRTASHDAMTSQPYWPVLVLHRDTVREKAAFPLFVLLRYFCGPQIVLCEDDMKQTFDIERCIFGLVILSPDFFTSEKRVAELHFLMSRHQSMPESEIVIPIFYQLTPDACSKTTDLGRQLATVSGYEHTQQESDRDFWVRVVLDMLINRLHRYGVSLLPAFQKDYHEAEAKNSLIDQLLSLYQAACDYYVAQGPAMNTALVEQCVEHFTARESFRLRGMTTFPSPDPHFVGRTALLEKLWEQLEDPQKQPFATAVLTGIAQVGKSAVAVAFAAHHYQRGDYQWVYWLPAENATVLQAAFWRLAEKLDIPKQRMITQGVVLVYEKLALSKGLLVFDHIGDPMLMQTYLPQPEAGQKGLPHVVITSCSDAWEKTVHVKPFSIYEARNFIQNRLSQSTIQEADSDALAECLEYLPGALNHALLYMIQMNISIALYLAIYRQKAKRFMEGSLHTNGSDPFWTLPTTLSSLRLEEVSCSATEQIPAQKPETAERNDYQYGFFISHRGTVKQDVAFPLLAMLRYCCGPDIAFYDQVHMPIAREGGRSISQGVATSRVGLVILSRDFFMSDYTTLDEACEFMKRHEVDGKTVIPVFYELTSAQCQALTDELCGDVWREYQHSEQAIADKKTLGRQLSVIPGYAYHAQQALKIDFWVEMVFDLVTRRLAPYGLSLLPAFQKDYTQEVCKTSLLAQLKGVYYQALAYHEQCPKLNQGDFERFFSNLTARERFEMQQVTQLPLRNTHFVGRHEILKKLWQQLEQGDSVAAITPSLVRKQQQITLHSAGGIGKTELALEFAHQHHKRGDYQLVRWMLAENPNVLRWAFLDLAAKLGIVTEHLSMDQVVKNVYYRLSSWQWLLVFDNANDYEAIKDYLPPTESIKQRQHVIITARNDQWEKKIALEPFSCEESIAFIQKVLEERAIPADCQLLSTRLGGLPFALNQAACHIRENKRLDITSYLNIFCDKGVELLTVGVLWEVSIQKIKELHWVVEQLLFFCALLQCDAIPLFLLRKLPFFEPESATWFDQGRLLSEILLPAISRLRVYGLVEAKTTQIEVFKIHSLLQEVINKKQCAIEQTRKEHLKCLCILIETLGEVFSNMGELEKNPEQFSLLVPHVYKIIEHYDKLFTAEDRKNLDAISWIDSAELEISRYKASCKPNTAGFFARMLHGFAIFQGLMYDYFSKKKLLERALSVLECSNLECSNVQNDLKIARILLDLGSVYKVLHDVIEQQKAVTKACKILERIPSEQKDDRLRAKALCILAGLDDSLGDTLSGQANLEEALTIFLREYGKDHVLVAKTLGNLGGISIKLGNFAVSKILVWKTLLIFYNKYGWDHIEVASALSQLAVIEGAFGDVMGQEAILKLALEIHERVKAAPDILTKNVLNLVEVEAVLGHFEDAEFHLLHVYDLCKDQNLLEATKIKAKMKDIARKKSFLGRTLPPAQTTGMLAATHGVFSSSGQSVTGAAKSSNSPRLTVNLHS